MVVVDTALRPDDAQRQSSAERATHRAPLWFALFGGAAAWSAQEMASYALVEYACYPSSVPLEASSARAWHAVAIIVSVVAFVVAVVAVWIALRTLRSESAQHAVARGTTVQPDRVALRHTMAFAGLLASVMFLALIIFNGIALSTVRAC